MKNKRQKIQPFVLIFWLLYYLKTGIVFSLFVALIPLGGLMNLFACYRNKGMMPVYCSNDVQWQGDEKHVIKTDKSEIRCFYLCDIINLPKLSISIGDIVGAVGICVGVYWIVVLLF